MSGTAETSLKFNYEAEELLKSIAPILCLILDLASGLPLVVSIVDHLRDRLSNRILSLGST
jgi:hypothetical protein